MKREQEREDNISIVPRGERRERKFIPTPGFSKLSSAGTGEEATVRYHENSLPSSRVSPLFLFLSLSSRGRLSQRERRASPIDSRRRTLLWPAYTESTDPQGRSYAVARAAAN